MTKSSPQLTLRARIFLILCGCGFALVASVVALQIIPMAPKGTEFNTIDDVRRAMMKESGESGGSSELSGVAGRPVSLRALVRPHPSDAIIYTLRPNLDLQFIRARVRTNSCGMRSPERPVAKPPGTYRIALLGDSFAFGWGVEQEQSFAQVLEDTLNRQSAGKLRFEVLNFGVPGYSTFQEVALFKELGLQFDPDAVLVFFVQNDFGMPFFIRDVGGNGGILDSLKFVQLGKQLLSPGQINKQLQNLGLDPNRALKDLDEVAAEHGIRSFLTINPRKSEMSDFARLQRLRGLGMQFIPLRDLLLQHIAFNHIKEEDLTLSFDPHPSPLRHNMLGALLTPYFMEALP
jgi:hypothetical protein